MNSNKAMVLLLVAVFAVSMAYVPFAAVTPTAAAPIESAPASMEQQLMDKYANQIMNDVPSAERMDPTLRSFMESGYLDSDVVKTSNDEVKIVLFLSPDADYAAVKEVVNVNWRMDLKLVAVISGSIADRTALKILETINGVKYIQADRMLDYVEIDDVVAPDQFAIDDIVGASYAQAKGYTGDGVVLGIVDDGADFSAPDLKDAVFIDEDGNPGSFDPTGHGITEMVVGNYTNVANVTAWLEEGNVLTYKDGTDYYINVTGWDPMTNNEGGHRSLMGLLPPYGDGYPYGANIGFIGLYEWAWGINNGSEFVYNEMWKDWKIPEPADGVNYTFGWVMQQRQSPYNKLFAPSMIYDGELIIDWNGTLAWTMMWNWAFYYEEIDLNVTADRDWITGMMDWDFTDEVTNLNVYKVGDPANTADDIVLSADMDNDGVDDIGIGSLSWAYDGAGFLSSHLDPLVPGISADNMTWAAMYNSGGIHGTWCTSAMAGRAVYDHALYDNSTTYTLAGMAPDAKVIATRGLTSGSDLGSQFWAAGFHLDTDGNFTYTTAGAKHKAHIISNSWGYVNGAYLDLTYLTLSWDLLSVPEVINASYPGTLFFVSAGNSGGDYMTGSPPGDAFSVVSVGGTIATHIYDDVYGPQEQYSLGQEAWFASNGPNFVGSPKPDVVAPAIFGFSATPSINVWSGLGDSFSGWSGTSLACPIAVGVGALIAEALMDAYSIAPEDMNPLWIKNVLLSSAKDLGYDPFIQGHGLVDAAAAIDAIDGTNTDDLYITAYSFDHYADAVADAWAYWIPDWNPFGVWFDEGLTTPVGLESSSIFFGNVQRDGSYWVNMTLESYTAIPNYYDPDDFTYEAWYWEVDEQFTYEVETTSQNDTNLHYVYRGDMWNMSAEMDSPDFTAMTGANYVTISATFDADYAGDIGLRIIDYNDTNADTVTNYYYNATYPGDYLQWISRDTNNANSLHARLSVPEGTGTIADLFNKYPCVFLDDDNANETHGTDVLLTFTIWKKTTDAQIGDDTSSLNHFNFTLDVASDAEYGINQGTIKITHGTWTHMIPYSYMVTMDVGGAAGDLNVLANGTADTTVTPYDNQKYFASYDIDAVYSMDGGGYRTFVLNVPDVGYPANNISTLVLRAEWENPGTVVDMYLRAPTYHLLWQSDDGWGGPFDPTPTEDTKNTLVYQPGGLINGTYYLAVGIHVFDGAAAWENVTLTIQWFNDTHIPAPTVDPLFWERGDEANKASFDGDDVLTGDHIFVSNTWDVDQPANVSEYDIAWTRMAFLSGLYEVRTGTYADPGGLDDWPIALSLTDNYVWEGIKGDGETAIKANEKVQVSLDAGGVDPSFDVYVWDDANNDGLVGLDEIGATALLSVDDGGGDADESGSFTAAADMDIAIRVFTWAWAYHAGAQYILEVDTRQSVDEDSTDEYTEFDTYDLGANFTYTVIFTAWTYTDVVFTYEVGAVTFNNHFVPQIEITAPEADDEFTDEVEITWTASDYNSDDEHFFEVLVSSDGGTTFQLLAKNITTLTYTWNSEGFLIDEYVVMVRVYDNDPNLNPNALANEAYTPGYMNYDISGAFLAGTVQPQTTTEPTDTDTGPTTPPGIDPLWIGLLGGIGIGVVVILILFLVKRK